MLAGAHEASARWRKLCAWPTSAGRSAVLNQRRPVIAYSLNAGRSNEPRWSDSLLSRGFMSSHQPIRHILVAHDFEPNADAALEYAVGLAKPLGARVTVLHAYEVPSMGAPEALVMTTTLLGQIARVAQETLGKIADRARGTGVLVDSTLRQGVVWREVEAFAKEGSVDLIVVGTHGRKGLPRALLGSVAEKIVRTAPCPVLVVRGAARGETSCRSSLTSSWPAVDCSDGWWVPEGRRRAAPPPDSHARWRRASSNGRLRGSISSRFHEGASGCASSWTTAARSSRTSE